MRGGILSAQLGARSRRIWVFWPTEIIRESEKQYWSGVIYSRIFWTLCVQGSLGKKSYASNDGAGS